MFAEPKEAGFQLDQNGGVLARQLFEFILYWKY